MKDATPPNNAMTLSDVEYADTLRQINKDSARIHFDQAIADSIERLKGKKQAPLPDSALNMSAAEWEAAKRNLR